MIKNNYKLIVDVGNTNIKFGVFDNTKLINVKSVPTKTYKLCMLKVIEDIKFGEIYIGSVVDSVTKKLSNDLLNKFNIKPIILSYKDFLPHLNLNKFNVKEIGLDILAYSLFLKNNFNKSLGICFGTATFAIAVMNNELVGAIIAPSIENGIKNLNESTSKINFKNNLISTNLKFGTNTDEAISSGVEHMVNGFVLSLEQYVYNKYKIKNICVTGGNHKYLSIIKNQKNIKFIDNAVLKGYSYLLNWKIRA